MEVETLKAIAAELEKLAAALRNYPQGAGGPRDDKPAASILASLKTINATLADGAKRGSLGPEGFTTIGKEFEKIGKTLQALGSGSGGGDHGH
jgi:hypothetical protein